MSHSKPKKKKPSGLFDLDSIKAKVEDEKRCHNRIRESLRALKEVDLQCIMADALVLKEDEALQLLACKLSVEGLLNLRFALQHVPDNIPRVINGISLRLTFVFKVYSSLPSQSSENLSVENFMLYVRFAETYCSSFLSELKECKSHLWGLTQKENMPFNKFLTPPVTTCLQCQKKLSLRNYPSKAKLFTQEGPIPCSKVTLECRDCSHVYGICNYSNESGTLFYPPEYCIQLIEVSNVTYFDPKLYKWFPSFR